MPIFALNKELIFPDPALADPDGILAVGGDLRPERLLLAYRSGIFPWYNQDDPLIWWSPDPRFVLFPRKIRISKSMRPILRNKKFDVSFDQEFLAVIKSCQKIYRPGQHGTWITEEMIQAYCKLHELGFAHSVEVKQNGELVGGLYGVSLGRCFFGESMFAKASNASKVGFITLVKVLEKLNFELIDCQVFTTHLQRLGAEEITRKQFLNLIKESLQYESIVGSWKNLIREETI